MPSCSEQQDNELCASVLGLAKDVYPPVIPFSMKVLTAFYRYPDGGKGTIPVLVWLMGCGFQLH